MSIQKNATEVLNDFTDLQKNIYDLVRENMEDVPDFCGVVVHNFPTDVAINKMGPDSAVRQVQSNTISLLNTFLKSKKER